MKKLFTVVCFLILQAAQAQMGAGSFSFRYDAGVPVKIVTKTLANPWAGGINGAQYSTIHLDADTIPDLATYDRQTNRIMTFLAERQAGGNYLWRYAPQYEEQFPTITFGTWMLLVDYNHDGKKDLFTNTNGGLRILQNTSANGRLSWKTIADPVYHEGLSGTLNLYINSTDLPAILDLDDDGDMDLLTYDINGSTANLFQNMSIERKGDPNGLDFKRIGFCWGGFQSGNDCDEFLFGVDCAYVEGNGTEANNSGARIQHNGNSMLIMDVNGDGKKDLLTAHITCRNVSLLPNTGGNGASALFQSAVSQFPTTNPISFDIFPALYAEDFDLDGKKDLVASPNTYGNDGNLIDYRASNWLYHNAGTDKLPDFRFVGKTFLQDEMIDLGENAAPALADLDGDGDKDLLIGNMGVKGTNGFRASLAYFENVGTAANPSFELRSTDYLKLSEQFLLTGLKPAIADIDGNGSPDLVFTGLSISNTPEIRYIPNTGARGAAFQLDVTKVQQLPTPDRLGISDRPTWYDVDQDGKADLLIGKQSGSIEYHRNTGTSTVPKYELKEQNYGQVNVLPTAGSPSIVVADFNGDLRPELLTGTRDGILKLYQLPDQPGNAMSLLDSTLIINSLTQTADGATPGGNLLLTAADLNGDGLPEVLVGTSGGGVRYLRNTSEKALITGVDEAASQPWVFPNPTERYLKINAPENGTVDVVDLTGRLVLPKFAVKARIEATLDLGTLQTGVYFVRFANGSQPLRVRKVIVSK